jgi:NAD(P)-dependent dehydrogenase (short-subunit alcohol dehydrogenase family)
VDPLDPVQLLRELHPVPETLEQGHDRLPGLGEQRVVETGDEQGDAHPGTVRFRFHRCYPEAEVNDLFSVQGKTAVVTGGSRGIGLMIARGYVEGGARVYISSRKADACEQAAAELSRAGECLALPADLSSEQECLRLAGELGEREQRVHVLVNNAGATWGAPLEEYPAAAWDKLLDLNLKAPFFLTRALLPLLRVAATADDPARVINVGSIDGLRVPPLPTYAYSASKAGVHHLTRVLARELGPQGVTVNAIAPGPFESKMMARTLREFGEAIVAAAPLGRIGRPDDVVGAALYLAGRAGAYVTGAVIPVDGGISTTL